MRINRPKISILCSTYNHKKYIRQSIDGFLAQKTNFEFEILINDDASNDGTIEIIKEYANRHPNIIKPNFQKANQYSKGYRNMIIRYLLPKAQGDYIALCEGDDYWIDQYKLKKQIDFLEQKKDYSLCFHPVKVVFEDKSRIDSTYPKDKSGFTLEKLLKGNYIQTNSVVYRRQEYKGMALNVMPGDWYLHLYHAQFGKIGFINDVMSVYRRHEKGLWHHSGTNQFWSTHGLGYLELYHELLKLYGNQSNYRDIIYTHFGNLINELGKKQNKDLLNQALTKYSDDTAEFLAAALGRLQEQQKDIITKDKAIANLQTSIKNMQSELKEVQSSYIWKLSNKTKSLGKKVKRKGK